MMDAITEEHEQQMIESEEYSLSHLADDDDFGERDGDEGFIKIKTFLYKTIYINGSLLYAGTFKVLLLFYLLCFMQALFIGNQHFYIERTYYVCLV